MSRKGPWKQHEGQDGKIYANVRDAAGRCVADCGSRTDKEAQANAKLIAAAPELLKVCRDAKSLLNEVAEMNIQPFPISAVELNRHLMAVIAKAT